MSTMILFIHIYQIISSIIFFPVEVIMCIIILRVSFFSDIWYCNILAYRFLIFHVNFNIKTARE
jgi:hypothetical protein